MASRRSKMGKKSISGCRPWLKNVCAQLNSIWRLLYGIIRNQRFFPEASFPLDPNLVPRVLWLFSQRVGASRDSGVLEFSYRKISAVKQWKSLQGRQSKNFDFFEFPRVSTGAHPLTKKPEDSGTRLIRPRREGSTWTFRNRIACPDDAGHLDGRRHFL